MDNEQAKPTPTNGQRQVLNVDLGSASLRAKLENALTAAGFPTMADGIRTIVRDITAGRIQYIDGILQRQA